MTKYFLVKWQVSRLPFVEHFDGKVALVKTLVYCKEKRKKFGNSNSLFGLNRFEQLLCLRELIVLDAIKFVFDQWDLFYFL